MSNKRPRALIDIDGVCADFFGSARVIIHELCGKWYDLEDLRSWDIFDTVPAELEEECFRRFSEPGFCANIEPIPGTVEGLAKISQVADIYIVTAPMHTPTWAYERTEWVKNHLGITKIIQTSYKYAIAGDILVDDKTKNVVDWAHHHPRGYGVIWESPHNKDEPLRDNIVRVSGWDSVFDILTNTGK